MKFSDKNQEKGHNPNLRQKCGTCESPYMSVTTAFFVKTVLYSNFQTLWQDTNDRLIRQHKHIYFKFLRGKKRSDTDALCMLRASLQILHSLIS